METSQRYTLTLDGLYVLDSWDCYREVHRPRHMMNAVGVLVICGSQRPRARLICDRFNREHDEWMARGRGA